MAAAIASRAPWPVFHDFAAVRLLELRGPVDAESPRLPAMLLCSRVTGELVRLFLKLGLTAFGGPAAHVAMMEEEVVRRRKWLTHEELLDLVGATNLIPGPNSTELALHIGYVRGGVRGMCVAGTCFIVPAAIASGILAWAYVTYGKLPAAAGFLWGLKPVIVAVVAQALWQMLPKAAKTWPLRVIGIFSAAAAFAGVNELIVLFGAAFLAAIGTRRAPPKALAASPTLLAVFLFFLKTGSVLFGSGYVLLAFLRADLVDRWHWLTEGQLVDAIAVGQITPGPVFTAATFIGYLLGGAKGAVVATIGIFLPAFVFVAISGRLVPFLRKSPTAGAFLDGLNVASLALMAVVSIAIARTSLVDPWTAIIAASSLVALMRFKVSSVLLVLGGAAIGVAVSLLR
jgi:chromate transporter